MKTLEAKAIRAYVARDWQRARDAKRDYWRERLARGRMAAALAVSAQLQRRATPAERSPHSLTSRGASGSAGTWLDTAKIDALLEVVEAALGQRDLRPTLRKLVAARPKSRR